MQTIRKVRDNNHDQAIKKEKGWIEILPRFKIQYPMKNRGKNTDTGRISYE
jgi:hypothetical protein